MKNQTPESSSSSNIAKGFSIPQKGFVPSYRQSSSALPEKQDVLNEQSITINDESASRKSNTDSEAVDKKPDSSSTSNVAKGFSMPQKGFVSSYRQSSSALPAKQDVLNEQPTSINDESASRKSNTDNEAVDKKPDSSSTSNTAKGFSVPHKGFVPSYRQTSSAFPTNQDGSNELESNKPLEEIHEQAASKNEVLSAPVKDCLLYTSPSPRDS